MEKSRRARYTHDFKLEALRMVGAGQSIAAVAAILGLSSQTLHNWIKAQQAGRLEGVGVRMSPRWRWGDAGYARACDPLRYRLHCNQTSPAGLA
jgi:transposase-like protein